MNYKMMGRFIAQILSVEGIFMVPALIMALCLGETMPFRVFWWPWQPLSQPY